MKFCILDNGWIDAAVQPIYQNYGAMTERLLRAVGSLAQCDVFSTVNGHYPASFAPYDAVLLTGSAADAFATEPWVLRLRQTTEQLLAAKKKLLGICFGHQLLALCLGAPVGRAPQGWGVGRMTYQWLAADWPAAPVPPKLALLASHQDQVFELPQGARLLAGSDFCPVAAFAWQDQVFCVQGHPEFVPEYSAFLLNKNRASLGEERYQTAMASLAQGHDGERVARLMLAFVAGSKAAAA